jgi:hypothetical protein
MGAPITMSAADVSYTNVSSLMIQASTMFGFALIVTTLRCYVRLYMLKAFGRDDWTIIVSMVSCSVMIIRPRC